MSLRSRFFAATYDHQMRKVEKAGLSEIRTKLVSQAAGAVLAIGGGTGANLAHFPPAVTSLTVTEPDASMLKRLERQVSAQAPSTMVLRAPAEDLPFEDDTFDTVVSTLVLCGVDDQPRAVREIRRVLRPEGHLLFLEHVRSANATTAKKQDRMNWINRLVVCCDCNRPTLDVIREAGFAVATLEDITLPNVPSFVRPAIVGSATPLAITSQNSQSEITGPSSPNR
jgi:ubiquinone/menaquinone biosynthesis C-methylase UbiE